MAWGAVGTVVLPPKRADRFAIGALPVAFIVGLVETATVLLLTVENGPFVADGLDAASLRWWLGVAGAWLF